MMQLNYGIIGCGMMGQEHLKNVALLDAADVVAVFEPNDQMAQEAQRLAPNAKRYDSVQALLSDQTVNCLIIASPNYFHLDQLIEIQRTRVLPILVEKPLFTNPDDLEKLEQFIDTYDAPVWVAMEYRYMPPITALREQINSATGGVKQLTIREHRFPFLEKVNDWNRLNRKSGGTFVEKCCHFFDLMRLLVDDEPTRIYASAGQAVNHLDERYEGEASDIWDHGYVAVDFNNGTRAMLELSMFAEGSRYQEEISAVGAQGKIEAFIPGPGRFWPKELGDAPVPQVVVSPRNPKGPVVQEVPVDPELLEAGDHNGSTFYQHQRFAQLCRGEIDAPEVSLNDGMQAVLMGLAAQSSARSGQSVDWPPQRDQLSN
jgi:predicted dehydrogenase